MNKKKKHFYLSNDWKHIILRWRQQSHFVAVVSVYVHKNIPFYTNDHFDLGWRGSQEPTQQSKGHYGIQLHLL